MKLTVFTILCCLISCIAIYVDAAEKPVPDEKIQYKTVWVKNTIPDPIIIEVEYSGNDHKIICNNKKFKKISLLIAHLNKLHKKSPVGGILFFYSSKQSIKLENILLDQLIKFGFFNKTNLYVKYPISKKTEYVYQKYIWTPSKPE